MKKLLKLFLAASTVAVALPTLTACGNNTKTDYELVVYNWEDYIATGVDEDGEKVEDSVVEQFEKAFFEKHGKTIKVHYETFSTNEDMLNQLKQGAISPDIICPSDYAIQKMVKEDLLLEFDYANALPNYKEYGSPYIKDLFEENGWSNYALPYMWGTMGFTYNPEFNETIVEDAKSWDIQWNSAYQGKVTIKDSVRDTYFTAVLHVYKDEIDGLKAGYEAGTLSKEKYNAKLTEVFNRCDDETLRKVEAALISLKDNIYGLEVDDGKNDIVTGKIAVNLAWSGDAVYSLDVAEEDGVYLNYTVPEEGSNIWFDAWAMPKGANVELASEFLDFICKPSTAAQNMNFVGYTPAIAGEEIWELVNEWYAAEDGVEADEVDLGYFFNGTLPSGTEAKILVPTEERGRQFDAQYPDEETIARCAIMRDFGDQTNAVYEMWNNFKSM